MSNNLILDYILATTNLYGIVPLEKVVQIYNHQNDDQIGIDDVEAYFEQDLSNYLIYVYFENFVHEKILEFDEFDLIQANKGRKPYYVPAKEELLKYVDVDYYEKPKQYHDLYKYIKKNFFRNDEEKVEMLCHNILWACVDGPNIRAVFDHFKAAGIDFEDGNQINEVVPLVMDLTNNVRLWQNNGYTPNELSEKFERSGLTPLWAGGSSGMGNRTKLSVIQGGADEKSGRNDPCPCGSGKKYKKCCLGKERR